MSANIREKTITVPISGRIDSNNAGAEEERIRSFIAPEVPSELILDAEKLEYISSAGLRILLRLRKEFSHLRVVNVNSEVYEILDMTGFTEMMSVEKAYRVISVDGCEVLGEGFNATVYRIDGDNVAKVYKHGEGIEEITHERENARLALILGVPTAISYDIVRVGESYASVFELLNARSFSKILSESPERMAWCVNEYIRLLRSIHSITVPDGKLPSIKDETLAAIRRILPNLPEECAEKLISMAEAIPETNNLIHGDYHTRNIVLADGEVMLIDMDTLSVGHPIFEFAQIFNSYIGFSEFDNDVVKAFQGFNQETATEFFDKSIRAYFSTEDEARILDVTNKLRCIAYAQLIDWKIRHTALGTDNDRNEYELWRRELIELLGEVDGLCFDLEPEQDAHTSNEIEIEAVNENLQKVLQFVDHHIDAIGCTMRTKMQIDVAVEEVFVNIASYAYAPNIGNAKVRVELLDEPRSIVITFTDSGCPYDPLANPDPDVTLPAQSRQIGGLGVFMTKKLMDAVEYEFVDGQNILTLKKNIEG